MASQVEIANLALSKLGKARISDITEDNAGAEAMSARWNALRDAELQAYPWGFAKKRVELVADSTAPNWGYAYAYTRPADDLRPLRVGEHAVSYEAIGVYYAVSNSYTHRAAPFEIVEGKIHSDLAAPLKYEYLARITDTGSYTPLFVELLASRLAVDACEELTQSASKMDRVTAMYREARRKAAMVHALERPPQQRTPGTWFGSRFRHG